MMMMPMLMIMVVITAVVMLIIMMIMMTLVMHTWSDFEERKCRSHFLAKKALVHFTESATLQISHRAKLHCTSKKMLHSNSKPLLHCFIAKTSLSCAAFHRKRCIANKPLSFIALPRKCYIPMDSHCYNAQG